MAHRHCFEAVDRTLRDILSVDDVRNSDIPFGGKPILLGGDFRQVLPVVQGADHSEIIRASLLSSRLWAHFTVMRLTVNMRLVRPGMSDQMRSSIATFARWVLGVGEGTVNCPFTLGDTHRVGIQVPERYLINGKGSKMIAIMEAIYDDFDNQYSSMPYLAARSVVCPTNSVVDDVNSFMVTKVPGCVKEYLSSDGIANCAEQPSDFELLYPPEFLNSIYINNFPQHRFLLKPGVPVVLLRNINQSIGLCNGTCLLVQRLGDRVIEARIMTGNNVGLSVAIPRIVLNSSSTKWPLALQRRQFPMKVCYAMTINKSDPSEGRSLFERTCFYSWTALRSRV
jgi:ATP-dependent DNA helicase PIF1